jgi:hypothetical protein
MGLAFAYFLDFETKEFIEMTVMTPFGRGFNMPSKVSNPVGFNHKDMNVFLQDMGPEIKISVDSPYFQKKEMSANFQVYRPAGHESLNVVIPWSPDRYQFTSKQECLPAEGRLQIGDKVINFPSEASFACLDFGRGVWKYSSSWNWGAFSGKSGSHIVGINLGDKWTSGTGYTENGIVLDGRMIKIGEEIRFEYDPADFMKPWRMKTHETSLVDLTFIPFFERVAKTDALILKSEVHQMIGYYSGTLQDEDGNMYPVDQIPGWAEEHYARW